MNPYKTNEVFFRLGDFCSDLDGIDMLFYGRGHLSSNVYILDQGRTLIDTGNSSEILFEYRERYLHGKIERVILTHAHPDHISGLFVILSEFDPEIYIHEAELEGVIRQKTLKDFFEEIGKGHLLRPLKGNENITTENFNLRVLYTPGHTPGTICVFDPERKILFSSDVLFPMMGEWALLPDADPQGGRLEELAMCVRYFMKLEPKAFLPGHLFPVWEDVLEHIKRTYFELQLKIQQREDMAYINTGIVLADAGRLDEAIECFDRVLEKEPKHPGACFVKGLAMMQKAQFERAVELFDRALEVYPDFKEAKEAKLKALQAMGKA